MTKVSVIIPIYNVEKYLAECLDSVINQTLKDIEIICVNDGSSDASLEILKEYIQKDKRVMVLSQVNLGVAKARNNGILASNSEFVAFIDPDDIYPSDDVLETLYSKAKENNVLICGGEFSYFNQDIHIFITDYLATEDGLGFKEEGVIKYQDYQFDYGYCRFIYNREFILKNEIFFPYYSRFQDPPFFVKAMYLAHEFYAIKKNTYLYRINHKELVWTTQKANDVLCAIKDNFKFAHENNLEKLNYYTFERLKQHFLMFRKYLNLKSLIILGEAKKYNKDIERVVYENKINFLHYCVLPVIRKFFCIRNSENKKYKLISILGIRIKLTRGKIR